MNGFNNGMTSSAIPSSAPISSADRLGFTVFVALALHALIILGISFKIDKAKPSTPTLEITLSTHSSNKAPDQADFIAQHNQQASGTGDRARELTTEHQAEFADTQIRNTNPRPQTQASNPSPQPIRHQITTTATSSQQAIEQIHPQDKNPPARIKKLQAETIQLSEEIASLQARLDRQRQAIANRPRVYRMTSVSTKSAIDAAYNLKWSSKVEFVGNRNFPQQALEQRIFGSLRLLTVLNPDGTIDRVEIRQSSGQKILDDAALQIVHLAAPFEPFPAELRKKFDKIEIIRTWHFEINGLSTDASE